VWALEDFMRTMRTGLTPEGKTLDVEAMPWDRFLFMTDEELEAIYQYLRSLGTD